MKVPLLENRTFQHRESEFILLQFSQHHWKEEGTAEVFKECGAVRGL